MAKFKGLIKYCEVCNKEFKVSPSLSHVKTCSRECGYKIRKVANKVEWVTCICKNCGGEFKSPPSQAVARVYCSTDCQFSNEENLQRMSNAVKGEKNPSWKGGVSTKAVSSAGKTYYRSDRVKETVRETKRNDQKKLATPSWANPAILKSFYKTARDISLATGVQHHVDHVIPLQNELVCGLHCEANLRIITAADNLTKHNDF